MREGFGGKMEEVPIEVDLGNRKEIWTCEQRWGAGKYRVTFDKLLLVVR